MITESQLMELKCRMLVAAEAAGRVAERGQDDVVLYNEDEYAEVSQSLRLLASDLGMVFGELDTLRMLVRREFAPIFSANKIAPPQPKQTLAAMVVEVAKSVVLEVPEAPVAVESVEVAVVDVPVKKKRGRPRKVNIDDNAVS